MNDTSPEMEAHLDALCAAKSPAERLHMGCSMFSSSRELVKAGILRERPNISASDLRVKMFRIYYGDDFRPDELDRITEHLRNCNDMAAPLELNPTEVAS